MEGHSARDAVEVHMLEERRHERLRLDRGYTLHLDQIVEGRREVATACRKVRARDDEVGAVAPLRGSQKGGGA